MSDELTPEERIGMDSAAGPCETQLPSAPASTMALSAFHGIELEQMLANAGEPAVRGAASAKPLRRNVDTWSARDLIRLAQTTPPQPIIEGLLNAGDIMLLHGTEESYKSVMIVQCAEAISMGTPFLRRWNVRGQWRVGIIETEMHEVMMGKRLEKMFPTGDAPEHMYFMSQDLLKKWRREELAGKFQMIKDWVRQEDIQVLMIDTANDFFRGQDSASEERDVGAFFDKLRELDLQGRILVRHDRKRREIDDSSHPNELIRGSAEWKEDPEAIVHLKRQDKRTHEVEMEVGKLRYGVKPEPCKLWFDSEIFRLVPLPPIIALLEDGPKTRSQLISESKRFGLAERAVDELVRQDQDVLQSGMIRHERTWEIDRSRCQEKDWLALLKADR